MITRADLSWALRAVIPHAKDTVCIAPTRDGGADVYATDGYTVGVASLDDAPPMHLSLPLAEARDLERFVRPTTKASQDVRVLIATPPGELHVGYGDESEVYSLSDDARPTHAEVVELLGRLNALPDDAHGVLSRPEMFTRFRYATRDPRDTLRFRSLYTQRTGASIWRVSGNRFEGAMMGVTEEFSPGNSYGARSAA
jgi:hypothetical protein